MRISLCLPLLLLGCTNPYTPQPLIIFDQGKYQAALLGCDLAMTKWVPHVSVGDVAASTIQGGADSLSYLPINPAIPLLGAAGGAANAAAQGFDVTHHARNNVHKHCVEDVTMMDHSAIMAKAQN